MGTQFYGWTADGLLAWSATGADTVRNVYDAQRRRIATIHGTDTTLIDYAQSTIGNDRIFQGRPYDHHWGLLGKQNRNLHMMTSNYGIMDQLMCIFSE